MQDCLRRPRRLKRIVLVGAVFNISPWPDGCNPGTLAAITVHCESCRHQDRVGTCGVPRRQAEVPWVETLHVATVMNSFVGSVGS